MLKEEKCKKKKNVKKEKKKKEGEYDFGENI